VVNFTSGQGIVYGVEQYYHAPGKCSTMVLEVGARALTKHALNVHCGHDDIYGALDTGWIMLFGKDAQQTADQALILRRVTELSLTPGMNIMDGFLTSHLERTFYKHESELIREYLGAPDDIIDTPTEAQRTLFGPKRRRVPDDRPGQSAAAGAGAESGTLHAGHRGPAQQLRRADSGACWKRRTRTLPR
jgi:pyruvate-ferredoxin/flavodoxin oxidoreductase